MMGISELIGALTEANEKAGECFAALNAVQDQITAAAGAVKEAAEITGAVLGDHQSDSVQSALALFYKAEAHTHSMIQAIEDAKQSIIAGQENNQTFIGALNI